ncbi:hypothetical protein IAT38_001422 [Cryptococcus sp. DSM 104549]
MVQKIRDATSRTRLPQSQGGNGSSLASRLATPSGPFGGRPAPATPKAALGRSHPPAPEGLRTPISADSERAGDKNAQLEELKREYEAGLSQLQKIIPVLHRAGTAFFPDATPPPSDLAGHDQPQPDSVSAAAATAAAEKAAQEMEALTKKLRASEKEMEALAKKLQMSEQEMEAVTKKLRMSEHEVFKKIARVRQLEEGTVKLERTKRGLAELLQASEREYTEKTEAIASLESRHALHMELARSKEETLRASLRESQERLECAIEALKSGQAVRLEELEIKAQQAELRASTLQQELEETKEQSRQQAASLASARGQLATLQAGQKSEAKPQANPWDTFKSLANTVEVLKESARTSQAAHEAELQAVEEAKARAEARVEELERQIAAGGGANVGAVTEVEQLGELEASRSEIEAQHAKCAADRELLDSRVSQLTADKTTLEDALARLRIEKSLLRASTNASNAEVGKLRDLLAQTREQLGALEADQARVAAQQARNREVQEKMEKMVEDMAAVARAVKTKAAEREKELSVKEGERASLVQEVSTLQRKLGDETAAKGVLAKEVVKLRLVEKQRGEVDTRGTPPTGPRTSITGVGGVASTDQPQFDGTRFLTPVSNPSSSLTTALVLTELRGEKRPAASGDDLQTPPAEESNKRRKGPGSISNGTPANNDGDGVEAEFPSPSWVRRHAWKLCCSSLTAKKQLKAESKTVVDEWCWPSYFDERMLDEDIANHIIECHMKSLVQLREKLAVRKGSRVKQEPVEN